jgi:probable rRNA maturation factor
VSPAAAKGAAKGATSAVEIAVAVRANAWRTALPGAVGLCRRAARAAFGHAAAKRHKALQKSFRGRDCEISIVLAGDAFIARLNRDYRGKTGPTNVLSFPALSGGVEELSGASGPPLLLGDVVIAFETTRREAKAAGKPMAHHLAHLAVHGVLHLMGYDHEREKEAARMEALEVEILREIGVPDPYRESKSAEVA